MGNASYVLDRQKLAARGSVIPSLNLPGFLHSVDSVRPQP